jgi:hypothetical protein
LKLVLGEPQSLKGVEVHEVEVVAPIHKCLGKSSHPDQRVDDKGKPTRLGDPIQVVHPIENDWGFRLAQVLRDRSAHGVDHSVGELELAA